MPGKGLYWYGLGAGVAQSHVYVICIPSFLLVRLADAPNTRNAKPVAIGVDRRPGYGYHESTPAFPCPISEDALSP